MKVSRMPKAPRAPRAGVSIQPQSLVAPMAPTAAATTPSSGYDQVGTAASPSPSPLHPTPVPGAAVTPSPVAMAPRPNSGGTISRGGMTRSIPSDPNYAGPAPTGFGAKPDNREAWRGSSRPLPPNQPAQRPDMATPGLAQPMLAQGRVDQTERNDPMSNGNRVVQPITGSSMPAPLGIHDPARAMGFSSRGNRVPAGRSALSTVGATPSPGASPTDGDEEDDVAAEGGAAPGLFKQNFPGNQSGANAYHSYVRSLFADQEPAGTGLQQQSA